MNAREGGGGTPLLSKSAQMEQNTFLRGPHSHAEVFKIDNSQKLKHKHDKRNRDQPCFLYLFFFFFLVYSIVHF